jgi:hypothetical protein
VDRPLNKGRVGRWVKAGPMEGEDKVTLWITLMDLRKIANNQVCVVLLDLNVLLVQLIVVSVDTKWCTSIIFTGDFHPTIGLEDTGPFMARSTTNS